MGKQINLTLLSTGQTYSVNTDQIIEVVPLGSTDSTVKIFKEIHNSNSYQLIEVDQAPSAIVTLAGGDIASFTSVGLPNTVVITTFDIDNASGVFTVGETVRVGANTLAEVASATDDSMSLINVRNGLIANNDVITGTVSGETADVNQAIILYGFGTSVLGATFSYDAGTGAFTNGETVTIGSQTATVVSTAGGNSMVVTNLTGAIADNDVITGLTSTETAAVNDTSFAFTYTGGQTATRYLNVYRIKSAVGINLANVNRMAYDNSGIIQEAIMVSDSITTINAAINAAYDNVSLSANNTWTGTQTFSNAAGVTTNTITERTAAAGVTVDGVLLKDSEVTTDVINEATAAAGVTIDGVLLKDAEVTTDVINEATADAGVTIDGVLLKDGLVNRETTAVTTTGVTQTFAAGYNDVIFFTTTTATDLAKISNTAINVGHQVSLVYVAEGAGADELVLTKLNAGDGIGWTSITFATLGDTATLCWSGTAWFIVALRGAVAA